MNKRIILVGPTASGKTFLRGKLEKKGFECDISYTSRPQRDGEIDGIHYHFLPNDVFEKMIVNGFFYEYVEYNGYYYGTGLNEWKTLPLFIMETDGIDHIKEEDRDSCFVIYVNPPVDERIKRMKEERKWNNQEVLDRIRTDNDKFDNFDKFDIKITSPDF
jgi:guanylate kinase